MAKYAARDLVKMPASDALLTEWTDRPVDKAFIEASMTQWDAALVAAAPTAQQPEEKTYYFALEEPLHAPADAAGSPTPLSTRRSDGFQPLNRTLLENELDAYVEGQLSLPIETVVDLPAAPTPVRRVYTFAEPVTATSSNPLFTKNSDGTLIRLADGVAARVIIEETYSIEPGQPVAETLTGTLRDNQVIWTD